MSGSDECTHLAWLDLETTGLDKHRDPIIEMAIIVTDMNLETPEGYKPFVTAVDPEEATLNERLDITPWARDTHSANGLIKQIQTGNCLSPGEVQVDAIAHLASYTTAGQVIIAGSGVQAFDKPVLEIQMPGLAAWFPYYSVDVGAIRRFIKHVVGRPDWIPENEPSTHRAFDDARFALYQAHAYKDLFLGKFNRIVDLALEVDT